MTSQYGVIQLMLSESLCEETIAKNNERKRKVDEYYERLRQELDSVNAIIVSHDCPINADVDTMSSSWL